MTPISFIQLSRLSSKESILYGYKILEMDLLNDIAWHFLIVKIKKLVLHQTYTAVKSDCNNKQSL